MGALALHGLFVAVAVLLPRFNPPPPQLEFVPVQIIPAQALGVRRPAPPRRKAPPTPQVIEPEETPAPERQEEIATLPSPDADKKKKPTEAKPQPTPSREAQREEGPAGTAPGETGDQLGRRGGPQGNPLGTTAFGSEVGSLDNPDFTYAYYLDRLLSLIDAQWLRPSMGSGVKAVISFNINRDGSMSELRVEQSSGYNSFDLAALRAVQNAAPFPPLPRAYKHDDLGVHLIVR